MNEKTISSMLRTMWCLCVVAVFASGCKAPLNDTPPNQESEFVQPGSADEDAITPDPHPATRASETQSKGRWRPARIDDSGLDDDTISKINAIGYLDGYNAAPQKNGVTVYDKTRAWEGYNFYVSGHKPEAILTDMNGRVLHRWSYDFERLEMSDSPYATRGAREFWRRAHVYPNGDLLAIHDGLGMIKLDRNSQLLWEYEGLAHHDLEVQPDGAIYTLTRVRSPVPEVLPDEAIFHDFVVALDPEGKELSRTSIVKCVLNAGIQEWLGLNNLLIAYGDLFHANSVEILDGARATSAPGFKAGNVLVSLSAIDAIAVVDMTRETVVWRHTGSFDFQHHATVLENGNLMFFDNRGAETASTIYEIDPKTREVRWQYQGSAESPFFTESCGSAYRLPNGNTLITESDRGRSFEVTPDGEIVWEFVSPHRAGEDEELIATLFDLVRIAPDYFDDWITLGE